MLEALLGSTFTPAAVPIGRAPASRLPDVTGVQGNIKDAAVTMKNGQIYIAVGDSFRRYDPLTGITVGLTKFWGTITGGTMVTLPDRLLLLGGVVNGVGSNAVMAYNIQQGTWSTEALLTGMGSFFSEMPGVVVGDCVFLSSGRWVGGDGLYFISYNHVKKTLWRLGENVGGIPVSHASLVTDNQFIYKCGGLFTKSGVLPRGEIHKWTTNSAVSPIPAPSVVTIAPKVFSDTIAYYAGDKIVILGIYDAVTGVYEANRMIFDLITKVWSEVTIPNDPPFYGAVTCQDGQNLYSLFGSQPPAAPLNVEVHRIRLGN